MQTYTFEYPYTLNGSFNTTLELQVADADSFSNIVEKLYTHAALEDRLPLLQIDLFFSTLETHTKIPDQPLSRYRPLSAVAKLCGTKYFILRDYVPLRVRATSIDMDVSGIVHLTGRDVKECTLKELHTNILIPFFTARNVELEPDEQIIFHVAGESVAQGITVATEETLEAYLESLMARCHYPQLTLLIENSALCNDFSATQAMFAATTTVSLVSSIVTLMRGGVQTSVVGQIILLADALVRVFTGRPFLTIEMATSVQNTVTTSVGAVEAFSAPEQLTCKACPAVVICPPVAMNWTPWPPNAPNFGWPYGVPAVNWPLNSPAANWHSSSTSANWLPQSPVVNWPPVAPTLPDVSWPPVAIPLSLPFSEPITMR
jgi:hypothetical protein